MVSVLRSEDGSEADLSLHISDYDTDGGENASNKGDIDDDLMDMEDEDAAQVTAIHRDDLIERLDEVIGEDVEELIDAELVVKSLTKNILKKYEGKEKEDDLNGDSLNNEDGLHEDGLNEEDLNEDVPKDDSKEEAIENELQDEQNDTNETNDDTSKYGKEEEDLLQVLDEKGADEDANDYEMSMAQLADEDSEEATLKDETLTSTENSKSPMDVSINEVIEENESKPDRASPTDLMDIGDNVLDIGEVAEIVNTTSKDEEVNNDSELSNDAGVSNHADLNNDADVSNDAELNNDAELSNDAELVDDTDVDNNSELINNMKVIKKSEVINTKVNNSDVINDIEEVNCSENCQDITNEDTIEDRGEGEDMELEEDLVGNSSIEITAENEVALRESDSKEIKEPNIVNENSSKKRCRRNEQKTGKEDLENDLDNKENVETDIGKDKKISVPTIKGQRKRVSTDNNDADIVAKKMKTELNDTDTTITDITESVVLPNDDQVDDKSNLEEIIIKYEPTITKESKSKYRGLLADKKMAGMTRDTLEVFAVQKVCEALMYKTEIAALLKSLKERDATIEMLQKEVVSLNKQSKDLCIVHEKILQDLQRCMKFTDKPLLVPRITRSVGLQACTRDAGTRKTTGTIMASSPAVKPMPSVQKLVKKVPPVINAKPAPVQQTTHAPPPPPPKQVALVQQPPPQQVPQVQSSPKSIAPKVAPVKISPSKPVEKRVVNTTPTKPTGGAGVIDLTSDDDRKPAQHPRLPPGTKLMPPPQGHQLVVANGQQMMMKLPPPGNYLINNGVKVITTTIAQSPVLRPNMVNTIATTPRAAQPLAPSLMHTTLTPVPSPRLKQSKVIPKKHPAPFPPTPLPNVSSSRPIPPRPILTLSKTKCGKGIVLSWKINSNLDLYSDIASYQIYAYQETKAEPRTENWSKVGDVKALQLPMAVTLTQFAANNRYYFAVRAVDILTRVGPFSDYRTIGN